MRTTTYKLSLMRIFELLQSESIRGQYKDRLTGSVAEVGWTEGLSRSLRTAKAVFLHFSQRWEKYEKSPTWDSFPVPKIETFIRLADLLQRLDPPLVDPRDPEKKPILFEDQRVGETLVKGWLLLFAHHMSFAPEEADLLPKPTVLATKEVIVKLQKRLASPANGYILARLVKDAIERESLKSPEALADWIIQQSPFTLTPQDRALLISGIETSISGHVPTDSFLPTIPLFSMTLLDFEGKPFVSPEQFLDYCKLLGSA